MFIEINGIKGDIIDTDNWVQFNMRYIVDYKKRRYTKHLLNEKIRKAILATSGTVKLASATFEIVNIPKITIEDQDKTS